MPSFFHSSSATFINIVYKITFQKVWRTETKVCRYERREVFQCTWTTPDCRSDQLSVILRNVRRDRRVSGELLNIVPAKSMTAKGLFDMLQNLHKFDLDMQNVLRLGQGCNANLFVITFLFSCFATSQFHVLLTVSADRENSWNTDAAIVLRLYRIFISLVWKMSIVFISKIPETCLGCILMKYLHMIESDLCGMYPTLSLLYVNWLCLLRQFLVRELTRP